MGQILQVVAGRYPKLPDEILSSRLKITILLRGILILGAAKVSI